MANNVEGPSIELVERKLAAENGRFHIYLDHIRAPDGYEVPDYLVVKPKLSGEKLVSGVGVLPIKNGQVGLIRLFRHPVNAIVWEMPRGFLEPSEAPLLSAQRELDEETGLVCKEADWLYLGSILPEAGLLQGRVHLYAALSCIEARDFPQEEIGHYEFRWFSRQEVDVLIQNNQLEDASTIAALYKLSMLRPGTTLI